MGVRQNLVLCYGVTSPWSRAELLYTLCRNLSKEDFATTCIRKDVLNHYETVRNKPLSEFNHEKWFKDAASDMMKVVDEHHDFILDKLFIPKDKFEIFPLACIDSRWGEQFYLVSSRITGHDFGSISFRIRNGNINGVPLPTREEDRMLRNFSKKYLEGTDISFMCLHYHN